jgi:hypothetical protein
MFVRAEQAFCALGGAYGSQRQPRNFGREAAAHLRACDVEERKRILLCDPNRQG